jgi:hypothetical protein
LGTSKVFSNLVENLQTDILATVPLKKLLDYLVIKKPIKLLKIDVEGYEKIVFDGLDFSNDQHRPKNIIMEFTGHGEWNLTFCINYFKERQYEALNILGVPIVSKEDIIEENIWLRSLK